MQRRARFHQTGNHQTIPCHDDLVIKPRLIALRAGDPRAAFRAFKTVIESGGRWGSAFFNLALALEQLGRKDEALAMNGKAIEYSVLARDVESGKLLAHCLPGHHDARTPQQFPGVREAADGREIRWQSQRRGGNNPARSFQGEVRPMYPGTHAKTRAART